MEAYKKKVEEYNKHAFLRNTTNLLRGREIQKLISDINIEYNILWK